MDRGGVRISRCRSGIRMEREGELQQQNSSRTAAEQQHVQCNIWWSNYFKNYVKNRNNKQQQNNNNNNKQQYFERDATYDKFLFVAI